MSRKIVEVAAAVIEQRDGSFLLGRRPAGGIYAGWWEFPGGKVEAGETPYAALVRELQEELGITVEAAHPWITREHDYEHAHVRLHFFRVKKWSGELRDLQHDALSWERADVLGVSPVLPANAPVFAGLSLPVVYGITGAAEIGYATQMFQLQQALSSGLKLVQIREGALPEGERKRFAEEAVGLCHAHGAKVLINADIELARHLRADGVHLTAAQLMQLDVRPGFSLVAASCHSVEELAKAATLGVDFAVLGSVLPTPTHPGQVGMGWEVFARLVENYPLPVFALGGVGTDSLEMAQQHGAHGVAGIRGVWPKR